MKNSQFLMLLALAVFLGNTLLFQGCKKDKDDKSDYSISGVVEDPITGVPVTGATVQLLDQNYDVVIEVISDGTGKFLMNNVAKGDFLMRTLSNTTYKEMIVPSLSIGKSGDDLKSNFVAFMPVPQSVTVPAGAICGLVRDKDGKPLGNASVSISAKDESLTNGYFAVTKTNSEGQYKIGVIAINSPVTSGKIPEFKIKSEKDGFVDVTSGIYIEENYMIVTNPNLTQKPDLGNIVFTDGFESRAWTFTGYWHRQATANITNQAYLNNFVKLALGDNTGGAIPSVYAGNYMAWYGDAATGNFMGEHNPEQGEYTGGNGYYSNSGTLTSGVISLAGLAQAGLYFANWFEIESVNPNQDGYDIMEVFVIDAADTNDITSIGRMNPYSDPVLDDRYAIPYTSGGFNAPPVWKMAEFNLTPFVGKNIHLRFKFATLDASYNGFRGWFIDEVTVRDRAPAGRSDMLPDYPVKPKPRQ